LDEVVRRTQKTSRKMLELYKINLRVEL